MKNISDEPEVEKLFKRLIVNSYNLSSYPAVMTALEDRFSYAMEHVRKTQSPFEVYPHTRSMAAIAQTLAHQLKAQSTAIKSLNEELGQARRDLQRERLNGAGLANRVAKLEARECHSKTNVHDSWLKNLTDRVCALEQKATPMAGIANASNSNLGISFITAEPLKPFPKQSLAMKSSGYYANKAEGLVNSLPSIQGEKMRECVMVQIEAFILLAQVAQEGEIGELACLSA